MAATTNGDTRHLRSAAGKVWNDRTLESWPKNDFRVFIGDIGNEVTEDTLGGAFRKYQSFQKARVVRERRTGRCKGYGFVSFGKPDDMLAALKEMDRKYVGNRPIRVMRSKWTDREIHSEKNKQLAGTLKVTPANSKTLRKFKKTGKPVTGGKQYKESISKPTAAPRKGRGFHANPKSWTTSSSSATMGVAGSGHLLDNI